MNRIFKAFAACACTIMVASSCNGFLELYPRTELVESEFYKTEDNMMKALYAVINESQTRLMEVWAYASYLSDESETGGGIGEGVWKTKWDTFQYNPDNCFGAYWCGSWWNEWDFGLYNGVTAANLLIDKLEECSLSESFVKPLQAEGKFYRALFYYYLWMGYEQLPLIKKYLPVDEMYSIRKGSRQEVYEFMLDDLADNVINSLPDRKETVQGRVCKQAAQLLKAKIILFHRDESKYAEALDDLKGIIESNTFSLHPDFSKLWLKEGEWCSESIFDICFASNNTGEGNGLGRSIGGRNISDPRSAEQGGLMEGYGQCTMPSTIYNIFKPGDTRREGTVIVYSQEEQKVLDLVAAGALEAGSEFHVSEEQENYEGLGHYKYHPRKETYTTGDPLYNYAFSYRLFRYADVLLLATELEARMGSVSADGQAWFDQIRDRAFQDTEHRITLNGKGRQEILDILFQERQYEFTDEMQRWFDIMRFDKGTEILGSKGWTEQFRYFPIDNSEIVYSNGALTQNPAWE